MKVSNNVNITSIYQEQLKKAKATAPDGEFSKLMQASTAKTEMPSTTFSAPSGISSMNPALTGSPVKQADPAQTMQFAAEVVAKEPDVRAERVDRIKQLFDAGQYNVSAEAVAEKLFNSGILTKSWEG